jgi:hypothetical protein
LISIFLFLGEIYFVQIENLASPKCEATLKSAFFQHATPIGGARS